jgi:hypothetical protein
MPVVTPQNTGGARLAYVVVPLEGTVTRSQTRWSKDEGIHQEDVEEPAGYLIFFPRGHCLRLRSEAELARYGLDRDPKFVDLKGIHDPNTNIGRIFGNQEEHIRQAAYEALERATINLATAKTGKQVMPEQMAGTLEVPGLFDKKVTDELAEASGPPSMFREHKMRSRRRRAEAE